MTSNQAPWLGRVLSGQGQTHEDGPATDDVADIEPDQFADGTWVSGQPHQPPATADADPPVLVQGSAVELVAQLVERLVGVGVEQPDRVETFALGLSDGVPVKWQANPARMTTRFYRTDAANTVRVGTTEQGVRSAHTSVVLLNGEPLQTTVIGDLYLMAEGGAITVQVVAEYRSGLAPGFTPDLSGR